MALLRKSDPTNKYPGGSKTYIFPCDCRDTHYLRIERDYDFNDSNWIEIDYFDSPDRWRDKARSVFKILRGKDHCLNGVIVTQEVADEVIEALKGPYPKPE